MQNTNALLIEFDNKKAAALIAYYLAKRGDNGHLQLGFSSATSAFSEIGKITGVKPNTVKNFRDSYDPYFDNGRAGWHQNENLRPHYLQEIKEIASQLDDKKILHFCNEILSWEWLDTISDVWKECEKKLNLISDKAEVQLPPSIRETIKSFFVEDGLTIYDEAPTALGITSTKKGQKFVFPFADVEKINCCSSFINALGKYHNAAEKLKGNLLKVTKISKEQELYERFKNKEFDNDDTVKSILLKELKTKSNVHLFLDAIQNPNQSGINKSIFRRKKDVVWSCLANKLNLENYRTGYNEHLVSLLLHNPEALDSLSDNSQDNHDFVSEYKSGQSRNIIFYGAPGTGKSFQAASYVQCGEMHLHRTVFFTDYQYSDFVGCLKPSIEGKDITYIFQEGPFLTALKDAYENPTEPIVLLIEELNRGNAAAIFGDIFQLLDRDTDGSSKYEITVSKELASSLTSYEACQGGRLKLPSNLFITATMNNSDQAVYPLDTAFKRRWSQIHVPIDFTKLEAINPDMVAPKIEISTGSYSWPEFALAANELVKRNSNVPEDRLLGPFFLSTEELLQENLNSTIATKVLSYMWDDVLKYESKSIIFSEAVHTFDELQQKFNSNDNVFSKELLNLLADNSKEQSETDNFESEPSE